jgi:hypothetical protein
MITNRKFIVAFSICFVTYLLSDIFFNDAVIYLLGGLFGTMAKWLGTTKIFYFIWLAVLLGLITLYYKINNKPIKIVLIILLWALFYLIDAVLYEIIPDITSKILKYSHIGLSVVLKSLALCWIYYKGNKE